MGVAAAMAVVVTVVVVTVVVVTVVVATPQAVMVVDTGVAVAMAVDTSGVVTSADVILPASTTALLISVRATSVETTGLRAGTSSVEIISTTTRSATGTAGIILPGSAGPAGAAGVAAGVVGEAGSDRCSENRHGRATATADTSGADTLASLCGSQSESFTKLPLQRIEEVVKPTGPQQTALDQLNQGSAKAADELRASCPAQTGEESPTARLDVMNNRLDAMVQAAKTLRPTLGAFYASLSDEQKAQFNGMGQQNATSQENATGGRQQ